MIYENCLPLLKAQYSTFLCTQQKILFILYRVHPSFSSSFSNICFVFLASILLSKNWNTYPNMYKYKFYNHSFKNSLIALKMNNKKSFRPKPIRWIIQKKNINLQPNASIGVLICPMQMLRILFLKHSSSFKYRSRERERLSIEWQTIASPKWFTGHDNNSAISVKINKT